MIVKEQFIEPYVLCVFHNGYQIKEKLKNNTYQNVGDIIPMGRENYLPLVLSQMILSKKEGELNMKEFHDLRKSIIREIENKLINGLNEKEIEETIKEENRFVGEKI